jgi:hypothetical protein
VAIENDR